MRFPDLSAFKFLIHYTAESDIFWSERYHNRNAGEKIISAALKTMCLRQKQHRKGQTEGTLYRQVFYLSRLFPGGIKNPQVKET